MNCPKCKKRMIKVILKFVSYTSPYKYAYYCPTCDEKKEVHKMETDLSIFTFTSKKGNRYDGNYNFIAKDNFDAMDMAVTLEKEHNKKINDDDLSILFFNLSNPESVEIKEGFIHIE